MKKQTKQVKRVNKKHESGRSMIEMVGVLAVMGLITAAAFVLITSALRSQRMSRIDDDLSAIASGIRLLYANQNNFDALDGNTNAALNLIGYDNVTSPYGGKYTVSVTKADADTLNPGTGSFTVSFDADSTTACAALVTRLDNVNGGLASCNGQTVSVNYSKYAVERPVTEQGNGD